MKITGIQAFPIMSPLGDKAFSSSQRLVTTRQSTVVIVTTDEGIEGVGECTGAALPVAAAIKHFCAPQIIGKDPFNTAAIWDMVYRSGESSSKKGTIIQALSGIDVALWDIKGKALNLPVYKLLGGAYRNKARAYATGLFRPIGSNYVELLRQEAAGYCRDGFSGMKLKLGQSTMKDDLTVLEAIRDVIGPDMNLMVDTNCGYSVPEAIRLGLEMEKYNIYWFEEPVVAEDVSGMIEIRSRINIPLASGEGESARYAYRDLITRRAADYLQPDVAIVGGFTELQRIIHMASAWQVRCSLHCFASNITIAATLQAYATLPDIPGKIMPTEPYFEFDRSPNPLREGVTKEKITQEGGYIPIPARPGLGITLDKDFVREHTYHEK